MLEQSSSVIEEEATETNVLYLDTGILLRTIGENIY